MNKKIGSNAATQIAEGLKKALATSYALYLKTQNYHWNVEGEHFNALHAMFEEQYTDLAAAVDELAERIRALDFYAPGGLSAFAELSAIKDAPEKPAKATDMVKDLVKSHGQLIEVLNEVLETAQDGNDEVTTDLMIERLTIHEKTVWMLKSLTK